MPPQASPQPQRPPAYGGRKSTSVQPSSAVLIIPLPGIRLLVSASKSSHTTLVHWQRTEARNSSVSGTSSV